jgi:hypothetical protein
MHSFFHKSLPISFHDRWITNRERQPERALRNADLLYIPQHNFATIIYFVTVSQCSLRPPLTTVFRQNAGEDVCVCERTPVWCGSPLGLRKRDPPIIRVEISTLFMNSIV